MADKCALSYTHNPAPPQSTLGCAVQTCAKVFQHTDTKKVKVQKKDARGKLEFDKKGNPIMEDKIEYEWKEVTPKCRLVTRVEFKNGKFEPVAAPPPPAPAIGIGLSCLCLIMDSPCQYTPEVNKSDPKKLEKVTCEGGCGEPYYEARPDDPYTAPKNADKLKLECTMIVDHEDANKIKCACWVQPK